MARAFVKEEIKRLLERRHPQYEEMSEHWEFLNLCYEGGREWFEDNIFKYHKEGENEFRKRLDRAYRFNHTREVVDLVNKYLWRADVSRRDGAPESVKAFWEKSTLKGLCIDELMRMASRKSSTLGCPWMIIDKTKNPEVADGATRSKKDEELERVYAYIVSPLDVLDFACNDVGELQWILVRELYRDDGDPFTSSGASVFRYRLWDQTDWYLFEMKDTKDRRKKEYHLSDEGKHDLGLVPAIRLDNMISDEPYVVPALIADVAYLDRAVANYLSNLDAIIQDQTFSQLAMPAQNVLPGEDGAAKIVEMGTKRIFLYDGEGGGLPFFLTPDPKQAGVLMDAIKQLINEIYHSVGLAGERTKQDNSQGIDNSSGVAKQNDFERVNALLISKADSLETIENRIVEIVCAWSGDPEPETELVEYPDDFDARSIWNEFEIAMQLSLIQAPGVIRGEQMKDVARKMFPTMEQTKLDALVAAAVKWGTDIDENKAMLMSAGAAGAKNQIAGEAVRNRDAATAKGNDTKTQNLPKQPQGQAKG